MNSLLERKLQLEKKNSDKKISMTKTTTFNVIPTTTINLHLVSTLLSILK
jgi:hypothetical protein